MADRASVAGLIAKLYAALLFAVALGLFWMTLRYGGVLPVFGLIAIGLGCLIWFEKFWAMVVTLALSLALAVYAGVLGDLRFYVASAVVAALTFAYSAAAAKAQPN